MKAEIGSAKHQSKQQKISGLQKLKFYCQLCLKQCRDANGFKNHINSPSHQGRLSQIATNPNEDVVKKYSGQFKTDFLRLLKMSHGTKKINANKFYQEYILNDRDHVHMNSTKWSSLTQFVKFLGQNGEVRVENDNDDDELSFTIALIDRSPEAVRKQELLMKKQKVIRSDEEMSMKILKRQMERGEIEEEKRKSKIEENVEFSKPVVPTGPIKMSLNLKPGLPKKKAALSAFGDDDDDDEKEEKKAILPKKRKIAIPNIRK